MNKSFKTGVTVIVIIVVVVTLLRINNSIDQVVKEQRPAFVESYKIVEIEEVNNHTIVYSMGIVNKEQDNIYFIDVLKNNFLGYEWIDSRGHINRDIVKGQSFDLSMQLLKNEAMNGTIVFGIVKNSNIKMITIGSQAERHQTPVMQFVDKLEGIYTLNFEKKLTKAPLTLTIDYLEQHNQKTIIINPQQLEILEEGKQIYLRL